MVIPNAGKVTSIVAKKDVALATRIEEAMKKNESLEALTTNNVRRAASPQSASTKGRPSRLVKTSNIMLSKLSIRRVEGELRYLASHPKNCMDTICMEIQCIPPLICYHHVQTK